jgi:hypothetical protein
MRVNLVDVFNEPDPVRRAAVIAEHYAEGMVWHEPDRIIRGRNDLERRAEQLRAENPGWVFRAAGPASELDDIGHLAFHYGPAAQPPMASGMDIARTHVAERQPSSRRQTRQAERAARPATRGQQTLPRTR